jgi:DNA-binding response OmpR family regulator
LILLVEDDSDIQEINREMLELRGCGIRAAMNLAEAREKIAEKKPDAIVLDIMLPDGSGLDFLKELRENSDIPVLLLTALGDSSDVVRGIRAGGDDYLPKPYDYDIFMARIEALLRRSSRSREANIVTKGPLTLDVVASRATLSGGDLLLSQKEFAALLLLAQNEGKTLSAEYLYETIWKTVMCGDNRAIQQTVSRLRKKIEHAGFSIRTLRGEGYMFTESVD